MNTGTVELTLNVDHTGSFRLRSAIATELKEYPQAQYGAFQVPEVRFDHVFDVKGASEAPRSKCHAWQCPSSPPAPP